jgi:hypothetical protein
MSDNQVLIQSKQVSPLPIGPGGNNSIKNELNSLNTTLTMVQAQAKADTRFDPPVPQPITQPVIKESFCNLSSTSKAFYTAGILCIVYGIVAK